MRILNIITTTDPAHGGPMEWVRQYGILAKERGHTVEVLSMDEPHAEWLSGYPLKIHAMGNRFRYFYSSRFVPWLIEHASEYDHIIIHGLWRYPSWATQRALSKLDLSYFVYLHGMLGRWFKQHYPLKHAFKSLYWHLFEKAVIANAEAVLFTCEQEKEQSPGTFRGYSAKREIVVPLGISDPNPAAEVVKTFYDRFPEMVGKKVVLFIGRVHEVKGCDLLIKAFAHHCHEHPDLRLVLAGPDSANQKTSLEQLAQSLSIHDRVLWTGMIVDDVKWGAMNAASVVTLISHHENFSFSTVEALACARPVLVSNQVGIWREIEQSGAGLVCGDDVMSATDALSRWLALSEEARNLMGVNARCCFEKKFESGTAVTGLLNALSS